MTIMLANYEDYIAKSKPGAKKLSKDIVYITRESMARYRSDPRLVEAGTRFPSFYSLLESDKLSCEPLSAFGHGSKILYYQG
jgi:hypothetical protein